MRIVTIAIFLLVSLYANEFQLKFWKDQETFSDYLVRHKIDATKFFAKVDPDDLKFLSSIESGAPFFENSTKDELKEVLIPLGEEMQMHIKKEKEGYSFDIIPLKYKVIKNRIGFTIESNCFSNVKELTNNPHIATYLKRVFKDHVDFTKLQKGDFVAIDYEQRSINGLPWEKPTINAAYIKRGKSEYFALRDGEESYRFWTNNQSVEQKSVTTAPVYLSFSNPLSKIRITSKFTYKRWHPILHRYRPHLGIDYGAKSGTPIHAIADGKVVYAGWMRGYGKVVKINHGYGLVSLYAHQSKLLVKRGDFVKRGETIGKVGSTGRSTGPHLHLGFYKRGRAVNPDRYLQRRVKVQSAIVTKKVVVKSEKLEKELTKEAKIEYNTLVKSNSQNIYRWKDYNATVTIVVKKEDSSNGKRVEVRSEKGDA